MLKILLSHKVRVTIGFCIGSIVLVVRAFEDELFYDPFELFQSDFNVLPLPSYDSFHLLIGLLFRYVLNTVFIRVYFTPYLETVQ
jgi:exosortase F-associated protein